MNLHTRNLTGQSITFDKENPVFGFGYKVVTGPVFITGSMPYQGVPSEPIELATGDSNMMHSINTELQSITINASSGSVALQLYF